MRSRPTRATRGATALPRRPLLIALALPLLAGGLWLATAGQARAEGTLQPLDDAAFSAVHGAGLEGATIRL